MFLCQCVLIIHLTKYEKNSIPFSVSSNDSIVLGIMP